MHGKLNWLMRNKTAALVAALACTVRTHSAVAGPDAEREALARLIHEIEAFAPLIETAESQASPDTRIHFRYDWLRQDLERIRAGIQENIDAPRTSRGRFRRCAATTGSEPER